MGNDHIDNGYVCGMCGEWVEYVVHWDSDKDFCVDAERGHQDECSFVRSGE